MLLDALLNGEKNSRSASAVQEIDSEVLKKLGEEVAVVKKYSNFQFHDAKSNHRKIHLSQTPNGGDTLFWNL